MMVSRFFLLEDILSSRETCMVYPCPQGLTITAGDAWQPLFYRMRQILAVFAKPLVFLCISSGKRFLTREFAMKIKQKQGNMPEFAALLTILGPRLARSD
ncbi:hypothetical protein NAC44_13010 [Allorhizobium sp. BGMRC 0089]|uniref:hypothetical protein n=1 Tax=Allorhizobium sonneratiae TaxID=2934936 RepID=UPI0020337F56|nr:hypothetical protein [Allorhizobium sonneratiae]MCM2293242.1 hypothetical protein [Allorhizobium sonneratiae]